MAKAKIFATAVLSMLFAGPVAAADIDRLIAVVDNGVILQSELSQRLRQIERRHQEAKRKAPPERQLRRLALEQLILETVQLQMAERANILVNDAELLEVIQGMADEAGRSLVAYRKEIEAGEEANWRDFREQLRRQIIMRRLQQSQLRRRIHIGDDDIDDFLNSAEGRRLAKLRYRLLYARLENEDEAENCLPDLRRRVADGADLLAAVADADEACQWRSSDLGWRERERLPSLFEKLAPKLSIGELSEALRDGGGVHLAQMRDIQGHKRQLIEQTQVRHILMTPTPERGARRIELKLRDLRKKIDNGADFGELAQIHSEDIGSRDEGGDLGWVADDELDPTFAEVMGETRLDAVSKPFASAFGWHILQPLRRRRHDVGPERLRRRAFAVLFQRKYDEELESWLRELRTNAHVELRI